MSNEQSSERNRSIRAIKAMRRLHMVFIGSVKAFNELFKGSKLFGFFIKVLKANDLMMLDIGAINRVGIDEVDAGGI